MREISVDLPTLGIADKSDIGEKFQFQTEDGVFTGASRFVFARSLVS